MCNIIVRAISFYSTVQHIYRIYMNLPCMNRCYILFICRHVFIRTATFRSSANMSCCFCLWKNPFSVGRYRKHSRAERHLRMLIFSCWSDGMCSKPTMLFNMFHQLIGVHSLKLTKSHLKRDGWEITIVSFWCPLPIFGGLKKTFSFREVYVIFFTTPIRIFNKSDLRALCSTW